ncbi:MAG: DUF2892 domain-containing protein [Halorubrum sp.]
MKRNVGRVDATARVIGGVALVIFAVLVAVEQLTLPAFSALAVAVAGVVLVVEGATRRCLLYSALGIDRCPVD